MDIFSVYELRFSTLEIQVTQKHRSRLILFKLLEMKALAPHIFLDAVNYFELPNTKDKLFSP